MENTSDEEVALVYVRLVRHESPAAAAVIEHIRTQFGSKIALRAALVITLLKNELQHFEALTELDMYISLRDDTPEAFPLLQEAIRCCQESWEIPQHNPRASERKQPADTWNVGFQDSFDDLLRRVRQHTPITAVKLELIQRTYEATAGGYAATALIWLEAYNQKFGTNFLSVFTDKEIHDFSFFLYMHENAEAIDRFIEMLDCYRIEHRPTDAPAFRAAYDAFAAEQQANKRDTS